MSNSNTVDSALYYTIIIQQHLDTRWEKCFPGMEITHLAEGKTQLTGQVVDQSALFGILNRIRDLGLQLLLVKLED